MGTLKKRARVPILAAAGSAAAFAAVVRAVSDRTAHPLDDAVRNAILESGSPELDALSQVVTPLTAPAFLIAISIFIAYRMRSRGARAWMPIVAAPLLAMIAGKSFSLTLPQQNAPSSADGTFEPCFPSGHTTGAMTEALTIAYVLRREKAIGPATALAITAVPFIGGMNRLYRDRHWGSDIVAGVTAGSAIASLLIAASEVFLVS